ncbi:MAG: ferritin family protein [Candidatus Cloacimonadaceae bacterium]|jgi:rubrerythrin|nr:hypothetical protein [Candidatus Cloacimonadota bacterium]MDX9949456.1 ferritin family protein [Candidatus Syntrophosphaera sp.]NLN84781.1 hypothetical protein [Candidatus Cloacimonadota bacterium]
MDKKDLYLMALTQEIRSQRLYTALSKSFKNPENSAFFRELVQLEEAHEAKLRQSFGHEFPDAQPEPSAIQDKDLQNLDLNDPVALLEYAAQRETDAQNHYLSFAEQVSDPEVKEMLLELAEEEDKHRNLLLAEVQRIQGALAWFDPSELAGYMAF